MDDASRDQVSTFEDFIRSGKTLIADSNAASRQRMAAILSELGARSINLVLVSDHASAKKFLDHETPKLILCDFTLGSMPGLDLLQMRRARDPRSKTSVFALVTGNSSQSAVAQAAEEDVDTFILKPYTIASFKRTLVAAVNGKINPSPYLQTIEDGKDAIEAADFERAEVFLTQALNLDPKPSLAWFYLGQLKLLRKAIDDASYEYKNGLQFNGIHYKCLVGLYEVLIARERYSEAYQVVRKLARYFPANPLRLSRVVALAVKIRNFEDILEYYEIFKAMDGRTDDLVLHVCAAMNVCAKWNLLNEKEELALELFERVAVSSAGRTTLLRFIVETLVKFGKGDEAAKFLERFPGHTRAQPDFLASEYRVQSAQNPPDKLIYLGRKLLKARIVDPTIYEVLIESMVEYGMIDEAEEILSKAIPLFPLESHRFKNISMSPRRDCA